MATALERFTPAAAAAVRDAIADAAGNEVFFLGNLESCGKVSEVRVVARGNSHAAPAIMHLPRPGEVVIHNHPSGHLTPSDADLDVASALGNDGVGFLIVDNEATSVYVVVEPHRDAKSVSLDIRAAHALLAPGGKVASAVDDYEHRPEQLEMLSAVASAFNDDGILTVEAGTGTGKSFAYLVPAILWSVANRERVIVSTHTINLQEQLVLKDLPLLVQRGGLKCTVALVKGRRNYLCQRKAAQVAEQGQLIDDQLQSELRDVLEWAKSTKDGSLGDLPVAPRPEVWEQVVSENDNCLRARCPFYSSCFFYTARRGAAKADILVVNHSLLMADLALREEIGSYTQNAVLPPAKRLIIDEAHHLEDAATSYFGTRVSFIAIERALNRLQRARHPTRGVLPALALALDSIDRPDLVPLAQGAARWIEDRLLPARQSLAQESRECFSALAAGLEAVLQRPLGKMVEKIRVVEGFRSTEYWQQLTRAAGRLAGQLSHCADDLTVLLERIGQIDDQASRPVLYLTTEVRAVRDRLAGFAGGVQGFVGGEDDDVCRWLEAGVGRTGPFVAFLTAPVAVGPLLRRSLFERFATVVLTSATLAVGERFDYLHDRVGLRDLSIPERAQTRRITSPFDYGRQALVVVPEDLPEPTEPGFADAAHAFLRGLLRATGGGTFLLFTSYTALEKAWNALEGDLRAMGCAPLRQGDGNRHRLLREFVRTPRGVLFATDSFWEGVDVRGDALRCVVIARLPFSVPTEPIQQARLEAIEARGGSPFLEQTVPQAVIKLKQGFGRLIRSRDDRGAVVILDSRIVRRRYGRQFLESLPPARRLIGPGDAVLQSLRQFFGVTSGADY